MNTIISYALPSRVLILILRPRFKTKNPSVDKMSPLHYCRLMVCTCLMMLIMVEMKSSIELQISCLWAWDSLQKQMPGQVLSIGNIEKPKVELSITSNVCHLSLLKQLDNIPPSVHVGSEQIPTTSGESEVTAKKPKSRKKVPDIDFTKSLENDMPDIFAPPKNPKSLLLPANKVPCNITLPEDCHYRPESLVRLFLLPDVMVT